MSSPQISIVVPVLNEQDSLGTLVEEIRTVARDSNFDIRQIVFVDDGSTDGSWARIRELAAADPRIGGLKFRRNAGKAAALMAGFAEVSSELVFMMDADLQDPPVEIPRFLARMDEGFDFVSGWKRRRYDPWHKVYPSRVFNWMIGLVTGVRLHDHVCGFKCMRLEVAKRMRLYGEFHRFLGVFAAANGYRVTEIPTLHRARTTGVGKYGFARFAKGFLDMLTVTLLTRYRWRPQHLIGVTGLVLTAILALSRIPRLWWLSTLVWILSPAAVLVAIGMVAQLVIESRPLESQYEIVERVGWCSGQPAQPAQPTPPSTVV